VIRLDAFYLPAVQVLLDGVPLLDLPGMLKYVTTSHVPGDPAQGSDAQRVPLSRLDQEDSPARSLLMRIPNVHVRNVRICLAPCDCVRESLIHVLSLCSSQVIIDMTQKDPANRLSVSEYLDILQGKLSGPVDGQPGAVVASADVPPPPPTARTALPPAPPSKGSPDLATFPAYFDSSLYPLFLKMHWNGITPDDRVNIFCQVLSASCASFSCRLDLTHGGLLTIMPAELRRTSAQHWWKR
jgi:hypothetical protein